MSTDLTALLHRATDGHDPDLAGLAHAARRRGLAIRRRRQALGLVGAAAATALVLGGTQLATGALPGSGGPAATGGSALAQPELVRATGRTTAAALLEVLHEVSAGEATGVKGSGQGAEPGSTGAGTQADLTWTPASGTGPTTVQVQVRPGGEPTDPVECRVRAGEPCEIEVRPDGSQVERSTQVLDRDLPGTGAVGRLVSVQRPDGTEVLAMSTNDPDLRGRPSVPLTFAQLEAIAASPYFGPRMDAGWADPDRLPAGFEDVSAAPGGSDTGASDGLRSLQELADDLAEADAQD